MSDEVTLGTAQWGALPVSYMEGTDWYSREEIMEAITHVSLHHPGITDNAPTGALLRVGRQEEKGIKVAHLIWGEERIKFFYRERSATTKALLVQVAEELERWS
jgi:hypothetical protein